MKRKIIYAIACILFCLTGKIYSQEQNYGPSIIPPSPEAASLSRFVDFQISEYTGQTSINIPITNFTEGNLNMPISLLYKSGGFQVEETSSRVGLGWTLGAGGVVSRSMRSKPDEYKLIDGAKGFLTLQQETTYEFLTSSNTVASKYNYLKEISDGCADAQPDLFFFNVDGYSGKFQFDWDGNLVVDSDSPLEVDPLWSEGFNSELLGWEVTVSSGVKYIFNVAETTSTIFGNASCVVNTVDYTSSWFLSRIIAPSSGSDIRYIDFEYEDYTINNHQVNNAATRVHSYDGSCGGSFAGVTEFTNNVLTINGKMLKKIVGKHNPIEINFKNGAVRTDLAGVNLYELGSIEIKNSELDQVLKSFELEQDYSTNRLTLISLKEMSGTLEKNPYLFNYYGQLGERNSNGRDYWGFQNNNGNALFPEYAIGNQAGTGNVYYGNANREASLGGSKSGVLTRITYPTGGYDEYTYELHDYADINGVPLQEYKVLNTGATRSSSGNICLGGSGNGDTKTYPFTITADPNAPGENVIVRINVIDISSFSDFSAGSPSYAKIFKVGESNPVLTLGNFDTGKLVKLELDPGDYYLETFAKWKSCISGNTDRDRSVVSLSYKKFTNELLTYKVAGGVRVSKIEKFDNDGSLQLETNYGYKLENGNSSGFIFGEPKRLVYYSEKFKCSGDPLSNSCDQVSCGTQAIVSTSNIIELGSTQGNHVGYKRVTIESSDGSLGRRISEYSIVPNQINNTPPFAPPGDLSFLSGLMTKSESRNAAGTLVEENAYTHEHHSQIIPALKVAFLGGDNFPDAKYQLGMHTTILGHAKVNSRISKLYDPNGSDYLESKSETLYDDPDQNVIETKETVNGQTVITRTYYAHDVVNATNPGVLVMNSFNLKSVPVEVVSLVESSGDEYVTGAVYYEYNIALNLSAVYTYNSEVKIPIADFTLAIDNNGNRNNGYYDEPEVLLTWGNEKNVLDQKSDGVTTSYLYNSKFFPIASIVGAEQDEVFYQGFEETVNATLGSAKTGEMYQNTGTYNFLTQGGFTPPSGIDMVMSYWYLDNSVWKYSGELPFNNIISNGTGLDEVRAYKKGAQLTTYSHKYGYGVSSVTDANSISVYFIYDDLGRLVQQIDQDGNTLQQNEYNYSH